MKESRLTVDMSGEEHMYLKMASAKLGLTMREFVLLSVFEKIEELEDIWLVEKAKEILKKIEMGVEKTSELKDVKKRLL